MSKLITAIAVAVLLFAFVGDLYAGGFLTSFGVLIFIFVPWLILSVLRQRGTRRRDVLAVVICIGQICLLAVLTNLEVTAAKDDIEPVIEALDSYYGQHHAYPDSLNALVPAYLLDIPEIPCGVFWERPLRYGLVDGGFSLLLSEYPFQFIEYDSRSRRWR